MCSSTPKDGSLDIIILICFYNGNLACVGSNALKELQESLLKVSGSLVDIHHEMEVSIQKTGLVWRDCKYENFVRGIQPYQEGLMELSAKHQRIANEEIKPIIKLLEEFESRKFDL